MKNKSLAFTALLLIISIGNYLRIIDLGHTRTVEFLSIFAIGALAGILLTQIFKTLFSRK